MDKNAIFNEFKKKQEEKMNKVEEVVTAEEPKDVVKEDVIKPINSKKRKNRNKNKEIKKHIDKPEISTGFEKWKEGFLSNETNKDFMNLLKFYREKNFSAFDDDTFLKNKYEHPDMKTVVLDPTLIEINAGKGGTCYLIKPIYTNEYNYFLKNIGPRDKNPEEFMKYAIKTGVLYPKFDDEKLEKTAAGTILSLYNYILQFSDLTKTIKIIEV